MLLFLLKNLKGGGYNIATDIIQAFSVERSEVNMFNYKIQEYRLNSNISISEMAAKMYVDESMIIDFENGNLLPNFDQIVCMSEVFNVPLRKFLLDSGFLAFPNHKAKIGGLLFLLIVPLLASVLSYILLINNNLNWLWSGLVLVFVYVLLLYNAPLGLEELCQEWRFEDEGIVFMDIKNQNKLFLPFILLNRQKYFKKVYYSDINKVELVPFKKDSRIDNTLAFGPYSPRLQPSLQAFSFIKVMDKKGDLVILKSRYDSLLECVKCFV